MKVGDVLWIYRENMLVSERGAAVKYPPSRDSLMISGISNDIFVDVGRAVYYYFWSSSEHIIFRKSLKIEISIDWSGSFIQQPLLHPVVLVRLIAFFVFKSVQMICDPWVLYLIIPRSCVQFHGFSRLADKLEKIELVLIYWSILWLFPLFFSYDKWYIMIQNVLS